MLCAALSGPVSFFCPRSRRLSQFRCSTGRSPPLFFPSTGRASRSLLGGHPNLGRLLFASFFFAIRHACFFLSCLPHVDCSAPRVPWCRSLFLGTTPPAAQTRFIRRARSFLLPLSLFNGFLASPRRHHSWSEPAARGGRLCHVRTRRCPSLL